MNTQIHTDKERYTQMTADKYICDNLFAICDNLRVPSECEAMGLDPFTEIMRIIGLPSSEKYDAQKSVAHGIRYTPPLAKLSLESLEAALRAKNATAFFGLREASYSGRCTIAATMKGGW